MVALILKYVLPVVAVVALLLGVYEWGHANGTDAGYKSGWDAQQVTINKMVETDNAKAKQFNQRVSDLEHKSQQDTLDLAAANMRAALARGEVVTQYVHDNPQVAQSCGWDVPTVNAINQLIDADTANAANAASAPVAASGATQ